MITSNTIAKKHYHLEEVEIDIDETRKVLKSLSIALERDLSLVDEKIEGKRERAKTDRQILKMTFCGLVLGIGVWLLTSATAEVLGGSLDAWLKALLIEIGIVTLAVMKPRSIWENAGVKLCCLGLIATSFLTLKTGVVEAETRNLQLAKIVSAEVQNYSALSQKSIANSELRPGNQPSNKAKDIEKGAEYTKKLSMLKEEVGKTLSIEAAKQTAIAETAIRALILLLNIIFGHSLIRTFERTKLT